MQRKLAAFCKSSVHSKREALGALGTVGNGLRAEVLGYLEEGRGALVIPRLHIIPIILCLEGPSVPFPSSPLTVRTLTGESYAITAPLAVTAAFTEGATA